MESGKSIPLNLPKRLLLRTSGTSLRESVLALPIEGHRNDTNIASLDSSPINGHSPSSSVFHSSKNSQAGQNSLKFSDLTELNQMYRYMLKEHIKLYPNDTDKHKTLNQLKTFLDLFESDDDPFAAKFEGYSNLDNPLNTFLHKCKTKNTTFTDNQRDSLNDIDDYIVVYNNVINEIRDVVDQKTYIEFNHNLQSGLDTMYDRQTQMSSKQIGKLKKCLDKVIPKLQPLYEELENLSKPLKEKLQKTAKTAYSTSQQLISMTKVILNKNSLSYLNSNLETVRNELKSLTDMMKNEISPVVKSYEAKLNVIAADNDDAAKEIFDIIKLKS